MEALSTSLMGFFQKRKFRNCLVYIAKHNMDDPKTWEGADALGVCASSLWPFDVVGGIARYGFAPNDNSPVLLPL
jgi:hypothetical protein